MIEVRHAESKDDLEAARDLFLANAESLRHHFGSDQVRADAADLPGSYAPPRGRLYLARVDETPAGCVALQPIGDTVAEVKRMFVLTRARRLGVGRALMQRLIRDAAELGYLTIRLGTLEEMTAAQSLYRELGFREIPQYRVDEKVDTVFYELQLRP